VPRFRRPRSPAHLLRQVAAAALACLALVLAVRPPPSAAGGAAPATVPVAVAAADLPAGTVLTTENLATVELPADARPAGAAATPQGLTGQVLAAPVRSGEPVTDVRVVGPGLWSQVPDGLVASPVRLADLAVAGLLRAGDRVDVLAATPPGDLLDGAPPTVDVVAERALVLTAPSSPDGSASDGSPAAGRVDGGGLLVLAVAPETAQRLAAAGAAATLTVTLGRP
jgi:pilus assembly protein CpaB